MPPTIPSLPPPPLPARYAKRDAPRGTQWDVGYNASVSYRINPYMRLHAFGQYSGYGRSNSFHGYMNPMYPQSGYGMVLELKVTDWLDLNGGMERRYDPTKNEMGDFARLRPYHSYKEIEIIQRYFQK